MWQVLFLSGYSSQRLSLVQLFQWKYNHRVAHVLMEFLTTCATSLILRSIRSRRACSSPPKNRSIQAASSSLKRVYGMFAPLNSQATQDFKP